MQSQHHTPYIGGEMPRFSELSLHQQHVDLEHIRLTQPRAEHQWVRRRWLAIRTLRGAIFSRLLHGPGPFLLTTVNHTIRALVAFRILGDIAIKQHLPVVAGDFIQKEADYIVLLLIGHRIEERLQCCPVHHQYVSNQMNRMRHLFSQLDPWQDYYKRFTGDHGLKYLPVPEARPCVQEADYAAPQVPGSNHSKRVTLKEAGDADLPLEGRPPSFLDTLHLMSSSDVPSRPDETMSERQQNPQPQSPALPSIGSDPPMNERATESAQEQEDDNASIQPSRDRSAARTTPEPQPRPEAEVEHSAQVTSAMGYSENIADPLNVRFPFPS